MRIHFGMANAQQLQPQGPTRAHRLPEILCASDPHRRTFIRGLINFSMTFRSDFACRHVPTYARSDLHWWSAYVASWNGVQILDAPCNTLDIYMDASGSKGLWGPVVLIQVPPPLQ